MHLYEHGSEWRRWDLHVHTPDSVLETQFKGDWDGYITAIEQSDSGVAVVGITDYCSISGYEKVVEYRQNGRLKNIETVIPNIEFRITPNTEKYKGINIHILVSPDSIHHIAEIKNALSRLVIDHHGQNYACSEDQLMSYGRALYPETAHCNRTSLREGINNFKPSYDVLKKWYNREKWLKENSIVVAANGSKDGVSGIKDGGFTGLKKDIYQFIDMIFSATPSDIKNFTGQGAKSKKDILSELGRLVPCVHGSDAHSIDKLFEPDQKRYCWIKADPTFNGLKQVVFEPDRAFIGELYPETKAEYQTIKRVRYIDNSGMNRFSDKWIPLNKDLNTIIGGKSSGKSMLLYHIAKTINPNEVSTRVELSKSSTYSDIPNLDFEVEWSNNEVSKLSDVDVQAKAITYIPQLYINQLADKDGREDLNELVSKTLLQDEQYKDFVNAIENKVRMVNSSINDKIDTRFLLIREYQKLSNELNEIGNDKSVNSEIAALEARAKEIREKSKWTEKQEKHYACLVHRRQCVIRAKDRLTYIQLGLQRFTDSIDNRQDQWIDTIRGQLQQDSGLIAQSTVLKGLLDSMQKGLVAGFSTTKDTANEKLKSIPDRLAALNEKLERIARELKPLEEDVKDKAALEQLNMQLKVEREKLARINVKIKELEAITKKGEECIKELNKQFSSLINLYKSHCVIVSEHQMDDDIKIEAKVVIDAPKFDSFVSCYHKSGSIRTVVNDVQDENGDYHFDIDTHAAFVEKTANTIRSSQSPTLRKNQSLKDAYKLLYADYFGIDFIVTYKNDSIVHMSPGKRGLVLLSLMLELSNSTHPILIDQPEDNLDNRTIYSELKDFVRKCKSKRQIIMVTHNANLVVAADAECVVVADQRGQLGTAGAHQFEYLGGSLEHSLQSDNSYDYQSLEELGIRQHVCHILEGGISAFREREQKYNLL
ncbi:TrlF family AAA-like ATPase (plasmid) [Pseudoalteromonas lipolytica]|uniref:TrlF family AAA-like ATPase n=1 Tax=Pseudoalteromonas lipolytica TaxID=570156 RepID=UPI003BA170E6